MTKQIIVVGRGHSGTRAIAGTLFRSGIFMGTITPDSIDHVPAFAMYDAVALFGPLVHRLSRYEWDFSPAIKTSPPADYIKFVHEYLIDFENSDLFAWKLSETTLALPWLVQMFPNAYYIHWVRDGRDNILKGHGTQDFKLFKIKAEKTEDKIYNGAVAWKYIEDLIEATPKPKHWITVRFEDFVLNQDATLDTLEQYLDMALTKIDVRPESVGRWKQHNLDDYLPIMESHLKRHGYL